MHRAGPCRFLRMREKSMYNEYLTLLLAMVNLFLSLCHLAYWHRYTTHMVLIFKIHLNVWMVLIFKIHLMNGFDFQDSSKCITLKKRIREWNGVSSMRHKQCVKIFIRCCETYSIYLVHYLSYTLDYICLWWNMIY